jgi:hypothetical protein
MQFIRFDHTNAAVEIKDEIKAPLEVMAIFKKSC